MRHAAIYALHANVVSINDNEDGSETAYDVDGAEVTIDETAVASKATELVAADDLRRLRARRDILITETDHWALSDTAEMTSDQTAYRQALRDITNSYQSLDDVVWPTKP
jgi:hypothetical protein